MPVEFETVAGVTTVHVNPNENDPAVQAVDNMFGVREVDGRRRPIELVGSWTPVVEKVDGKHRVRWT